MGPRRRSTCASPTPRSTGRPRDGRRDAPPGPTASPTADRRSGRSVVTLMPMRRRHLRGVLRIEGQADAPRRGRSGCSWASWPCRAEPASTSWPGRRDRSSASPACCSSATTATSPPSRSTPTSARRQHRHPPACWRCAARPSSGAPSALTLEVRASNEPAQAMYRRFGFAPAGIRASYYAETGEDALVMWAHDVDAPDYAEPPRPHRGRRCRSHRRRGARPAPTCA